MRRSWAVCFDVDQDSTTAADSLGRLRLLDGVKVCQDGSLIWVRGPVLDDDLRLLLRSLPCRDRFCVEEDSQLTKLDERTPSGTLPAGEWTPIREFVQLALPVAGISVARIPRVEVKLVRSASPVEARFLLVTADVAAGWAQAAPQVRLDPLTFVVSDDGRFLFRGDPLPSLPGTRFVEHDRVLVPAGWTWSPAVDAGSLRQSVEAEPEQLVMLSPDGEAEKIAESDFVAASRAAIRVSDYSE